MELHQEGVSDDHATVKFFDGEKVVAEIAARVQLLQGGDGKSYPAVTLSVKESIIEAKFVNGRRL